VFQLIGTVTIVGGSASNPLRRIVALQKNGTEVMRQDVGAAAYPVTLSVIYVVRLVAGDIITVMGWQNSGVSLTFGANPGHEFQAIKLSD
jgi:hypothetical protein